MRIGIDIDNVISNFNDALLKEYLKHDKDLRNTGIINENPIYVRKGMFDWSEEEEISFYKENIERIVENLKPLEDVEEIINKLKTEGHEIYIISARDIDDYKNPEEITINWLKRYNINYDKLILRTKKHSKLIECQENKIDIMIDDNYKICEELYENGINVIHMKTRYPQHNALSNEEIISFSKWKQIYNYINNTNKKQKTETIKVILDTDTYNECDDQFALSYMIKSQERFDIEAITIAPFSHDNDISIQEGTEKSYQEVKKICKFLNFDYIDKVFKGATDYLTDGYNETNDAVEKIIQIANKNEKTYIMAIGAITNIAIAIKKAPEIINKIEIIWLGGYYLMSKNNKEYNFRQDIQAVKTVFESKVKLTIIPTKGVASHLMMSIYELEHNIKGKSELCNYLCERFYDDRIHGIKIRRPIWDISVIAYLINPNWFETSQINCPNINDDTSYDLNTNNHLITMCNYINSSKVYEDMFKKLGEI